LLASIGQYLCQQEQSKMKIIRRYPLGSFFVLALTLGSLVIVLIYGGVLAPELALTSALSASIAGIIMTILLEGKKGLAALLKRLSIWRVGICYWLFALFFLVLAILLGSLLNPFFKGDPASIKDLRLSAGILPMFLIFFITAGLGEEIGWTGFLLPRLQARYSAFYSSLIRAALVFIWHLPLLLFSYNHPSAIADFPYGRWMQQSGFIVTLAFILALSSSWAVLYVWTFNNTRGSLLMVAVLHTSEIWLAFLLPAMGIDPMNLNNYWGYAIILVLTAGMIVIITGPEHLTCRPKKGLTQ
jgi:membrane protease YdiL (CAAX protease family)